MPDVTLRTIQAARRALKVVGSRHAICSACCACVRTRRGARCTLCRVPRRRPAVGCSIWPDAQAGGCISATCYPGHEEGKLEEQGIFEDARGLPVEIWSCYVHQWINQRNKRTGKRAPSLVLYQRVADDDPPS
jgi:hypothetical protein